MMRDLILWCHPILQYNLEIQFDNTIFKYNLTMQYLCQSPSLPLKQALSRQENETGPSFLTYWPPYTYPKIVITWAVQLSGKICNLFERAYRNGILHILIDCIDWVSIIETYDLSTVPPPMRLSSSRLEATNTLIQTHKLEFVEGWPEAFQKRRSMND